MERTRIVFAGAGGQGVITAGIVLAEAAVLYDDLMAVQTQSYGAAARGGAARSDVILSSEKINYPKVVQPNILVCLSQEACNRYAGILRPGGLLIVDPHFVCLERKVDAVVHTLTFHQSVLHAIGDTTVVNICMLAAVNTLSHLVRAESIRKALHGRIPAAWIEKNLRAFDLGEELVRSSIR